MSEGEGVVIDYVTDAVTAPVTTPDPLREAAAVAQELADRELDQRRGEVERLLQAERDDHGWAAA